MEPFTILMLSLAFIMLFLGSITDFKTREVPDYLSYGMMILGLGLRCLYSLVTTDWHYFFEVVAGFVLFFALGALFFYLGQWGGGDSKVLMALGSLLGVNLNDDQIMLSFLINLLAVGSIYGLLWSFLAAVKKGKSFLTFFKHALSQKKIVFFRILALIISVILLLFSFWSKTPVALLLLAFLVISSTYLYVFMITLDALCFYKIVHPSKLTEGDWIKEDIKISNKIIVSKTKTGLSKEDLTLLQQYARKGKIKKVTIKEGMPFVPAFLITLLLTLWTGNLL